MDSLMIEGYSARSCRSTGVVELVKSTYEGASSLATGGKGFLDCLKEGLSFNRKCAWYSALRGADTLIRDGQFAEFRKPVCSACRLDPAFQWGVSTTWRYYGESDVGYQNSTRSNCIPRRDVSGR